MNYGYNFNPALIRSMSMPMAYPTTTGLGSLLTPHALGTTSKITFSGILNGASKTLGVINQAIPVFYQVKPIWNNAKTMFRVVKGINSTDFTSKNDISSEKLNSSSVNSDNNAPTFFA